MIGDDITPEFGQQEKVVRSGSLAVGGSAAITAVAAARLGVSVALVAALGPDLAGEFMRGELARAGVDASSLAVRAAQPTGLTVVLTGGTDRRHGPGHSHRAGRGRVAGRFRRACRAAGRGPARACQLLLPDGGLARAGAGRAARGGPRGRATTSLDTNWDPAQQWDDPSLRAALGQADLLLPNEAEARALARQPGLAGAVAALAGRAAAAGWWSSWGHAGRCARTAGGRCGCRCRR